MCGIAGIVGFKNKVALSTVKKMTDAIAHRGPDGEGHWLNGSEQVALGHRRLAIIDLSEKGAQPMHSASGRFTITFNGEIYNYLEIRAALQKEGHVFRTENDTEVLLKLFEIKGKNCLADLDGMFAFGIWDEEKQELFCARDRFGEKPLYYYKDGERFIFASELKAISAAGTRLQMNPTMAFNYEFFGYTVNPKAPEETFFTGISSLPHSHYLTVKDGRVTTSSYYSIHLKNNPELDINLVKEELFELLKNSVSKRMRGQVTIGSSFSGGVDSTIIVSLIDSLNKQSSSPLHVFSAIFPGHLKDEASYIRQGIAGKNIAAHYVLPVREEYEQVIDELFSAHAGPFTSLSVIAQYFVYREARKNNVTVLLDGQGADELFAGYHMYYDSFLKGLYQTDKARWQQELAAYRRVNENNLINPKLNLGRSKQIASLHLPGLIALRREKKIRKQLNPDRLAFYLDHRAEKFDVRTDFKNLDEELHYQVFTFGLPQLLKYADRNSMANGVEIRLPFLDHKIAELLFRLPGTCKIKNGWTKWILREAFKDTIPAAICWRTDKIGLEPNQLTDQLGNRSNVLNRFEKVMRFTS